MLEVRTANGSAVKAQMNAFYESVGSLGRSRDDDLFFIAYKDGHMAGCVRYCVESKLPLLRTMMVAKEFRNSGVGKALLQAFAEYLDKNDIRSTYVLPFAHLEKFYETIGFKRVNGIQIPTYLKDRLELYKSSGKQYICMHRS
jgi:N-acetylglutamate synthase-like GNAT family acetyltransferase